MNTKLYKFMELFKCDPSKTELFLYSACKENYFCHGIDCDSECPFSMIPNSYIPCSHQIRDALKDNLLILFCI